MKALLLSRYKHLELVDLPNPEPRANEVLIRVAACGICGSDVHGYDGTSGRRIPPIVMGHEAAGCVAALGANVSDLSIGERVTFDSTVYCGECHYCSLGQINLCDRRQVLGVSCSDYRRAGAFAEYVSVPRRTIHRLPENLSFAEAALLEAVSVALHAVSLIPVPSGCTALVVGAGTIGVLLQQALRVAGCARVFVADVDSSRLALSRTLGATDTLMANPDLAQRVRQMTNGNGVDLAFEAVGKTESVTAAIESVGKGGGVVLVGNITAQVMLPLQSVVTRQIRLQGSCASAGEYPRAIELLSQQAIRVKPLLTAIAPLEQGPDWFERLYRREPNVMKVVLTPGEL